MTESPEDIATNPGVQGIAQFGRNALKRIAQLERELAEARMDTARLDWLAKTDNAIGQDQEPCRLGCKPNVHAFIGEGATDQEPCRLGCKPNPSNKRVS